MASADAQKNGLSAFQSYEDPAWSWIDLVAALKTGDPAVARSCMQLAKESKWTHDQWELAMELVQDEDDPDFDIPNNPGWNRSDEEIDRAQEPNNPSNPGWAAAIMEDQKLAKLKQKQIDDFFEE